MNVVAALTILAVIAQGESMTLKYASLVSNLLTINWCTYSNYLETYNPRFTTVRYRSNFGYYYQLVILVECQEL